MASIFILPADVFFYILRYLDIHERIAFALTCRRFRQICVDAKVFRKNDFSRCAISRTQQGAVNRFFTDRHLTQHIRELNISNFRVINWQMDDQLEEFIISICPNLEVLHVLDCGMSLERLCRILMQAPKLITLSWSLWDFRSKDIHFLLKSMKSCEGIGLKNIKHLHLEIQRSKSHIQILKYLLLPCLRQLQELEIHTWSIDEAFGTGRNFPLAGDEMIPGFPQLSDENELQQLHSLVVVPVGYSLFETSDDYEGEFSDLILSVLNRKSTSRKWKKFLILPKIGINRVRWPHVPFVLDSVDQDDFQSVEAVGANAVWSANILDKLKAFLERIDDNTVRSLYLWLPYCSNSIVKFCDHIARVGGHSLKFLHLSSPFLEDIPSDRNVFIHNLFSNCLNVTELDLVECYFEKDICEPLSELKHLTKVQLKQCAISSKYDKNKVEISKANLFTFVKNCNITHLDVRGCSHQQFSCRLTDDDLLALAKLRKLNSLTLYNIRGITEWTFLKNISQHCIFLTTLRILDVEHFEDCHIENLMESAKFLKHLAISVDEPVLEREVFWDLLRHAKNLERLCIRSCDWELLNVPVAVETIKSLPRLQVLHLHANDIENSESFDEENIENVEPFYEEYRENVESFYEEVIKMLEEKQSDCRFAFEIVTGNEENMSLCRKNTWINHETGYSLISNKALPLNKAELCEMTPILDILRF